ncbi:GRIP and coiled-coil domain-containing protein 2-like [Saccostrea echinata]|uniref:GRIP and coiled-coil domain-containing protein 2-like n=1 Tax=Saccostrea echinata TaxID=191078 RepID=UPI002A818F32|nr:GRIP and coiled-coil domain-containing protein 2-like [Saccostrea echinata]
MHHILVILWFALSVGTKQIWSITNTIGEDCVVSLTIPRDSIKSSCNQDEGTLRKMQALEAKLQRLYTAVEGLEVRMPRIVSHQTRNQETMERLEFNLAQSATYVKKLEDKILDLESKLPQTAGGQTVIPQRSNSLDSLLDPVRPLVMNELESFKDDWMRNLVDNLVPAILTPDNKLGVNFMNKLIQSLKVQIKANTVSPLEIVESSSEIEDDEAKNDTKEEDFINEFMIVTKPTKMPETSSKSSWSTNAIDMLARTVKNVSFNLNKPAKTIYNNDSETEVGNSSNVSPVMNAKNVIRLLSIVKTEISKEMNLKINDVDNKYQNVSDILFGKTNSLEEKVSNFQENYQIQQWIMEKNISDIRQEFNILENKVEQSVSDLPQITANHVNSKFDLKMLSLQKAFSQKLQSEILQIENKIYSQSKRLNTTSRLVNIFPESLAKYQNQSQTELGQLQQKVAELSLKLKICNDDDSVVLKERLRYLEEEIQGVADSQLFMEQGIDKFKSGFTENFRNAQNEIQNLKRELQAVEYEIGGIDLLKVSLGNQDMILNTTTDKVNTFENKLKDIQKIFSEFTAEVMSENQWVPYNFSSHSPIRNDCGGGKKYIRKSFFGSSVVKFVGVQLCTNTRYKIFLGPSKGGEFYDIGDKAGRGEDHCQFVGATIPDSNTTYKVDKKLAFFTIDGYMREHWNEVPQFGKISTLQPTSAYYECGISIP